MIKPAELKEYTRKDLADLARDQGIEGWHGMRKDELIRALTRAARAKQRAKQSGAKSGKTNTKSKTTRSATAVKTKGTASGKAISSNGKATSSSGKAISSNGKATSSNGKPGKTGTPVRVAPSAKVAAKPKSNGRAAAVTSPPAAKDERRRNSRVTRRIQVANAERERLKDLSSACAAAKAKGNPKSSAASNGNTFKRDRVVVLVRDSYWLQVCWEINRQSVERVKAAMAEQWHTARPILRLIQVELGATTSSAERVECEIDIHGGVDNWYVDVYDPPKSYRVDIGYLSVTGKFHSLARSNLVTTPPPGSGDALDQNWSDVARDYERIYAQSGGYDEDTGDGELKDLFEERLRRPMGTPMVRQFAVGNSGIGGRPPEFMLEVDAELIIYGQTQADARVTLTGHPVKLRPDGSFTVRKSLPDRRQVLPVVSYSGDGMEQRTIILAIERNTKIMEPLTREQYDPTQSQ